MMIMKTSAIRILPAPIRSLSAIAAAAVSALSAFGFTATDGDLMIGMRQNGGLNELVINLGSARTFMANVQSHPGTNFAITSYSSDTMNAAFSDLSGVNWSVFASEYFTTNTLWDTRARTDLGTQSIPWLGKTQNGQGGAASGIYGVASRATFYSTTVIPADPINNTATAVIIPAGHSDGYLYQIGAMGDWNSSWLQGNTENLTPPDFVSSQLTNRSDLYYIPPINNQTSVYLGYFDLYWDGTIRFTAAGGPAAPPAPPQLSITRGAAPGVYTISFSAEGNNAIYRLIATNCPGMSPPFSTPRTNWPVVQGPITNVTAGTLSFQVTNPAPNQVYSVRATR
jgi:hypothetical protein